MIADGYALPPAEAHELIKSVYESTDTFVADFAEAYPYEDTLSVRLTELARRPGSLFLVAGDGPNPLAAPLGYLLVQPRARRKLAHTADLTMGVRVQARGRGVGGELLHEALDRLRREGVIEIVYLMVRADNVAARRLYEHEGFRALATLDDDIRIGSCYHDGILMRRLVREGC